MDNTWTLLGTGWIPLCSNYKLHGQHLGAHWELHGHTLDNLGTTLRHLETAWTTRLQSPPLGNLIDNTQAPLDRHYMTTWRHFWDNFETTLGRLWDNFGTTLGRLWDNFVSKGCTRKILVSLFGVGWRS